MSSRDDKFISVIFIYEMSQIRRHRLREVQLLDPEQSLICYKTVSEIQSS
jgi:hypothetical protein